MSDIEITRGSSNIFSDLGFSDSEIEQCKSHLARQIWDAMMRGGLSKSEAAARVGLTTRDFDRVINGRTGDRSIKDLHRFLGALTSARSPDPCCA